MTDWNKIQAFMAAVVPWPVSQQDAGYVNLHYKVPDPKNPNGKGFIGGQPFRSADTLVAKAAYLGTSTYVQDIWYCLSLQSQFRQDPKQPNKQKAVRSKQNALSVKSIWMDLDVGPDPKKYATLPEAMKAVLLFAADAALPEPSAMIASGNGLHVYWINKTAMKVSEWFAYADGLKQLAMSKGLRADHPLTTDVARILRMPGTRNFKSVPPKAVVLLDLPLKLYDFDAQFAHIKSSTEVPAQTGPQPQHNIFADGIDLASFGKPPAQFAALDDANNLQAGVQKHGEFLVPISPVFKDCGFYRDALTTGGADHSQPLWNLSVLGTVFMENGNAVAHAISRGHDGYTAADTEALFNRKMAERAGGLGYPSCSAIKDAGSTACATCPLFPQGKSPLNLRAPVTATVSPSSSAPPPPQSNTAHSLHLPDGYDVNDEGIICRVETTTVNGEPGPTKLYPLFMSVLSLPWISKNPDKLHFTTTRDIGSLPFQASLKHTDIHAMGLGSILADQHVKTYPENKRYLEQFLMSWLSKLHKMKAAQQALPFGWYTEAGERRGFVYGGRLMRDDNTEEQCGTGDSKLRDIFSPKGDIEDWYKALYLITSQQRPELEAISALAFAAPLTALAGLNATCMSAWGESAAGKSAAFSVGIAVWGHSKLGKQVSHSTFNSVMKTMGELNNLPLYWDEIKDAKAQASVYDFVYNAVDGVEKSRMKADTTMQDRGSWATQMMMAANISFVDYCIQKDPTHVASISRVLEYHVKRVDEGPGRISPTDANVILDKLTQSHGLIGAKYAKLLSLMHASIQKEVTDECKRVERDMQQTTEERFWVAQVGTLLVGARLANRIIEEDGHTHTFNVDAMRSFLYQVYRDNRAKRIAMIQTGGKRDTTEATMTGFFSQTKANDQMLWTNNMPNGPGKHVSTVLKGPQGGRNTAVDDLVTVRWDVEGRRCYVLTKALMAYLVDTKAAQGLTFTALKKEYGMVQDSRARIGGGTSYLTGRAPCCIFPNITPNHDWADLLWEQTPAGERPTPEDPNPPPETVDTGLTPTAEVIEFVKGAVRHG